MANTKASFVQGTPDAPLRSKDFSNTDLSGTDLNHAEACSFFKANLTGCRVALVNCNLTGTNLARVTMLVLIDCTASTTDFSKVAAEDMYFQSCDLPGCRFANLHDKRDVTFVECRLDGADFSGVRAPRRLRFNQCSLVD